MSENEKIDRLIMMAKEKSGNDIIPIYPAIKFEDAIFEFNSKLILWYNTPDHSTHVVTLEK
jgi:hypothetical protein